MLLASSVALSRGIRALARGRAGARSALGGRGDGARRRVPRASSSWSGGVSGRRAPPSTGAYGSVFYGLTALHAVHVAAGLVVLLVLIRALLGTYTEHNVVPRPARRDVLALRRRCLAPDVRLALPPLNHLGPACMTHDKPVSAPSPRRARASPPSPRPLSPPRARPTRCPSPRTRRTPSPAAGGDRHDLNLGYQSYTRYCYACHGAKGDGKGPASYGYRPPPRNFTEGSSSSRACARATTCPTTTISSGSSSGGLHGTPMLEWDVPEEELRRILQYIKTFTPKKWEKKKRTASPSRPSRSWRRPRIPGRARRGGRGAGSRALSLQGGVRELPPRRTAGRRSSTSSPSAASKREPDVFKPAHGLPRDSTARWPRTRPTTASACSRRTSPSTRCARSRAGHEMEHSIPDHLLRRLPNHAGLAGRAPGRTSGPSPTTSSRSSISAPTPPPPRS